MLTKEQRSEIKIVLDPGHTGTPDPGACGPSGLRESDINLAVAGLVHNKLQELGYNVTMTRWEADNDAMEDLGERVRLSNEFGADAFLSIHCNSFGDPSANGTQSYFYRYSAAGPALAQIMQEKLVAMVGLRDRGISGAGFQVIKYTDAVAVLLELAFISNPEEEAILADTAKQELFATAIVDGFEAYFDK